MERRLGDRRGRPRFEIVGELWGTLDTALSMPLLNVGRGGALVRSTVPLPQHSVHHVTVTSEGLQTPTSVQVRHVRPMLGSDGRDYFLIGLEFLTLPTTLRAQIDAWTEGEAPIALEGV